MLNLKNIYIIHLYYLLNFINILIDRRTTIEPSCDCNGRSDRCDRNGDCYNCRDNFTGPRCEQCTPGYSLRYNRCVQGNTIKFIYIYIYIYILNTILNICSI